MVARTAPSAPRTSTGRTCLVAYVYPGWHPDPYRPGVDEWRLLDRGPGPNGREPARPLGGPYDDAEPATARRHARLAVAHGIDAYAYFAYVARDREVMAEPYRVMQSVLGDDPPVHLMQVWCARLPHDRFPVGHVPSVATGLATDGTGGRAARARDADWRGRPLEDVPVELLRDELTTLRATRADRVREV